MPWLAGSVVGPRRAGRVLAAVDRAGAGVPAASSRTRRRGPGGVAFRAADS